MRSKRQKETTPIQVGDNVLLSEDNVSRRKWPQGRVEEVHLISEDELVRTVIMRVQKSILTRPAQGYIGWKENHPPHKPVMKKMVGSSCSRMLFPLRVFLFLSLDHALPSPMEDKAGRIRQAVIYSLCHPIWKGS